MFINKRQREYRRRLHRDPGESSNYMILIGTDSEALPIRFCSRSLVYGWPGDSSSPHWQPESASSKIPQFILLIDSLDALTA